MQALAVVPVAAALAIAAAGVDAIAAAVIAALILFAATPIGALVFARMIAPMIALTGVGAVMAVTAVIGAGRGIRS